MKKKLKRVEIGEHLVVDPGICFGKLTFKGTRVPVSTVLYWMSQGETMEQILEAWPYLKREAIAEAIILASTALVEHAQASAIKAAKVGA